MFERGREALRLAGGTLLVNLARSQEGEAPALIPFYEILGFLQGGRGLAPEHLSVKEVSSGRWRIGRGAGFQRGTVVDLEDFREFSARVLQDSQELALEEGSATALEGKRCILVLSRSGD